DRMQLFFLQAEDGIRDFHVTGVQTCALPILLSIDTTTGMSPPPIEATRCQPSASDSTVTTMSSVSVGVITYQTVSAMNTTIAPRFSTFLPGSMSGLDEMRPDSFRNATMDPVKVTPPMKMPMNTSAWWMSASAPVYPGAARWPFHPTSTAARPTKL